MVRIVGSRALEIFFHHTVGSSTRIGVRPVVVGLPEIVGAGCVAFAAAAAAAIKMRLRGRTTAVGRLQLFIFANLRLQCTLAATAADRRTAASAAVLGKPARTALLPAPSDELAIASTAGTRLLHVFSCSATAWKGSVKPHLYMHWNRVALAPTGAAVARTVLLPARSADSPAASCVEGVHTNRCAPSLSLHPNEDQ